MLRSFVLICLLSFGSVEANANDISTVLTDAAACDKQALKAMQEAVNRTDVLTRTLAPLIGSVAGVLVVTAAIKGVNERGRRSAEELYVTVYQQCKGARIP